MSDDPIRRGSLSDISQHRAKEKERRNSFSSIKGNNVLFTNLLKSHTVDDLKLSQTIVELDASQHSPMVGFHKLLKHNVLSAPVWDPVQNHYIGFLDIKDLASSILFSIKTQRARAKALLSAQEAPNQRETVSTVLNEEYTSEAIFHARRAQEEAEKAAATANNTTPASPGTNWDEHAEKCITRKFLQREKAPPPDADIHAVTQEPQLKYLARRHPFIPIRHDTTLFEAAKQLSGKVHRMPVVGENGRVVKIVSQSAITAFLARHLEEVAPEAAQTVEATSLGLKPVISARGDRPAIEAFEEIDNQGLSGLGVVLRDGSIVGNTSSRDLRYFLLDRGALNLDMNLVDYLASIRQREVEVSDHAPLCSVGPTSSIGRIISLLAATKYHRIYVVDPRQNIPMGVVSHTDILKYVTSSACTPLNSPKHVRTPSSGGGGGFRSGRRLSLGDYSARTPSSRSSSPAPRGITRSKSPAPRAAAIPPKALYCQSLMCWEYNPCPHHKPKKLSTLSLSPHPKNLQSQSASPLLSYPDIGGISRSVGTTSRECQVWANRGLANMYALHAEEALRCFSQAVECDPNCAMAHFGVSWSQGTTPANPVGLSAREGLRSAQSAFQLASSPLEKGLANALCVRYASHGGDPTVASSAASYQAAMQVVYNEFKSDADVAFWFATSILSQPNWKHQLEELLPVLEQGQFLNPRHAGLLHLHIFVHSSLGTPERAVSAAHALKGFVCGLGPLLFAPSLIDFATGRYENALLAGIAAVKADERAAEQSGPLEYYFVTRLQHLRAVVGVAIQDGQVHVALNYANRARTLVSPEVAGWELNGVAVGSLHMEAYVPLVYHVLIRFGRWHQILAMEVPAPPFLCTLTTAHYARAVCMAALGRIEDATKEQQIFLEKLALLRQQRESLIEDLAGVALLDAAGEFLNGLLEYKRGNFDNAFVLLAEAAKREARVSAAEPYGPLLGVSYTLGSLLLAQKRVEEAKAVFAAKEHKHQQQQQQQQQHDLWALVGLVQCEGEGGEEHIELRALKQQLLAASQRSEVNIANPSFFA